MTELPSSAESAGRFRSRCSPLGSAGLSLMGVPPSGGFVAKWLLLLATVVQGQWWWAVVMLAGGLLAGAVMFSWCSAKPWATRADRRSVRARVPTSGDGGADGCAVRGAARLVPLQSSEFLQIGRPVISGESFHDERQSCCSQPLWPLPLADAGGLPVASE